MRAAKLFPRGALCAPVFAAVVLTGGCALPVGVQVAFFAFDGFSLAATDKSLAGHGLSAASGQDCALHRIITDADGGPICRDGDEGVMTAEAALHDLPEPEDSDADAGIYGARADAPSGEIETAALEAPAPAPVETAEADVSGPAVLRESDITDGRYMVIGTYRTMENAERLALKRRAFNPRVLVTELRSGELHRVVVGPYAEEEHRKMVKDLARAGMFDVWAMGVVADDWPKVWAPKAGTQVAQTE